MKIIVNKNQTTIYATKENKKVLQDVIKSIHALKNYTLRWEKNRFIIKIALTQYQKTKIINALKAGKEKKKDLKIITGFSGCLITGHKLVWF